MQTISTKQLKTMRDEHEDVPVINVLSSEDFQREHIPDSRNIPVGDDAFASKVEDAVGGKSKPVIVYCASTDCDASPKAAQKLEKAGFRKVYDYEGGMKAWREAGLPIEAADR
jgi:rhodanese-related sulfurtransferase